MCDDQLLHKLKERQVKPKSVHCTQNSNCWCNDLSFRFPLEQIQEECMSPEQMLKMFGDEMSNVDKKFLIYLSKLPFIID